MRYAHFSYAELCERADWLRALPKESVRPSTYLETRILLGWFGLRTHDGEGVAIASVAAATAGVEVSRHTAFTTLQLSQFANVAGDIAEAERFAADGVSMMFYLGVPEANNYAATTSLANARERGTLGRLVGFADEAALEGHPAGAAVAISAYLRHLQGESVTEALDRLDDEEFSDDAGHPIVVAWWAETVASLADTERCRRFIGELESLTGLHLATGGICLGGVDRLLALLHDALGESDRADTYFARAIEQADQLRSPTWVARTELDWAESLIAHDRLADAREHLAAAETAIGGFDLTDSKQRLAALHDSC